MINEWLDNADKKMFEDMKKNNPRRYQVAGLGEWGVTNGLVYENFFEMDFDVEEIKKRKNIVSIFGLDFGYTNDPTALFCGLVDIDIKEIYVFDELYKKALTNFKIYQEVFNMGYIKEVIVADSAEPKSIEELRELGINKIRAAKKGKDSLNNGIQYIQDFKIIIHPKCKNFLNEICNYTWSKDEMGKSINRPIDKYNHLLDAMRYAIQSINKEDRFSFK